MNSSTFPVGTIILVVFLSLFFFLKLLEAYDPVDRFSISCGSSGNSSDSDRTWTGDINSKLLSPENKQTVAAQASTQSPSTNQVPYATARFSHNEFSYSFPVTEGPKFLRLFFYPSSYPNVNFDRSNALFTVKSGGFTLLKDFNASLTADAEQTDTVFREYIINVEDGQWLNLTFTPSTSRPNSYAFVNGIEVVSMPTNLYYTASDDPGFKFVGRTTTLYSISSNFALETNYRLRVGGNTISAKGDTGLLRRWDGNDADYLTASSPRHGLPADFSGTNLSFTMIPNYTAPEALYRTARDMGPNATLNKISNLTWEFTVDAGFTYMLRLHFCEFDPDMEAIEDTVFFIYIAEQMAEDYASILQWTNQKGIPVYRDYAVSVPGNPGKTNLSLQMHPLPDEDTRYSDPFLNGLEIFKISDPGTNNLAGPNPNPVPNTPPKPVQNSKSKSRTTVISVAAGVVSAVFLLSVFVVVLILRQCKKRSVKTSKSTKSANTKSSLLPSDLCRHFRLVEMLAATNNFDEVFIIGVGGFGNVYKGYIDGGITPVAIKRLKRGSQQGAHEFRTEIEMLSQLRHRHLVSLIGYCSENNEMILVYDFMARETLRDHLYNTNNPPLSWKQRLQICIGAARGLHYLHTGAIRNIIHRDVKTTNILLDEKWVAKVSDFGLSRIGPTGISKTHLSTVVKGSVGYLDPEYYKRQRLTEKSDVYSFGVVLFEVLCARPPLISSMDKKQASLADWARYCYDNGTLNQIVDPALKLKGEIAPECLSKFGEIAVSCLLDDGTQRPSMNDIVWMLEFALQLQESAEQDNYKGVIGKDDNDDICSIGTNGVQVSDFTKRSGVEMNSGGVHSCSSQETAELVVSGTVSSEIQE